MAERRAELIYEWIEQHPEVVTKVKGKLKALAKESGAAGASMLEMSRSDKEAKDSLTSLNQTLAERVSKTLGKASKSFVMFELAQQKLGKTQQAAAKKIDSYGRNFLRAGWRVGFFGWIVTNTGKQIFGMFQTVFNVMKQLIQVSADFPSSLAKVALAMGLLQSQGLLTADMQTLLQGTMQKLVDLGPKFMALWAGFEAAYIAVAVALTEKVLPAMISGLAKLSTWIVANADRLASLGEQFFSSFIPAIIDAIPAVVGFLEALTPILPVLAGILKFLGPVAPAILLIGTAMWLLGPILTVIGSLIGGLSALMVTFTGVSLGTAIATGTLTSSLGALGISLGTIFVSIAPFIGLISQAIILFTNWGDVIAGTLNPAMKMAIDIIGGVTVAITGLGVALGIISGPVGWIILAIEGIILAFTHWREIVDAVNTAMKWLTDTMNGFRKAVHDAIFGSDAYYDSISRLPGPLGDITQKTGILSGALRGMSFRHAGPAALAFANNLIAAQKEVAATESSVKGLSGALKTSSGKFSLGGPTGPAIGSPSILGGGGTSYITIYAPITFTGPVSKDADIPAIKEAVLTSLAREITRRS